MPPSQRHLWLDWQDVLPALNVITLRDLGKTAKTTKHNLKKKKKKKQEDEPGL